MRRKTPSPLAGGRIQHIQAPGAQRTQLAPRLSPATSDSHSLSLSSLPPRTLSTAPSLTWTREKQEFCFPYPRFLDLSVTHLPLPPKPTILPDMVKL